MVVIALSALAAPIDERPETAALGLERAMFDDPRAALARFALAEELGDDRALALVLPDPLPETLPWGVRDRAHLVLAREAIADGDDAGAREHLALVFPGSTAWTESRLLQGDVEWRAGNARDAALAYRAAVAKDQPYGEALVRFAAVYEELGRPGTVAHTLEMVPKGDPAWPAAQAPLARAWLAEGAVGEALGLLVLLGQPPLVGRVWAPEAELLRAAAEGRATAPARAELAGWADALAGLDEGQGAGAWTAWFGGGATLPAAWSVAFLRRPDVAPLVARIGRIDRERALATPDDALGHALDDRRAATLEALGDTLRAALADEERRLRTLATGPDPVVGGSRSPGVARLTEPEGLWWPYNGELWADEIVVLVEAR